MDLKGYYRKIREVEESIAPPHVVVSSHATGDGGRAGVLTEVSRANAAKLVVKGRARLATDEEVAAYHSEVRAAREAREADDARRRLQVTVLTEAEVREFRESTRKR
jgi:tRNA(Arg) A34 adenosine deaminase TadA